MFFLEEISLHLMKKNKNSLQDSFSLSPLTTSKKPPGRTFLHTFPAKCRRAGMVVEAAVVLPLFLLAMLTMIGFMDFYVLQTRKLVELCQTVQEAGVYAAALEEETELDLTLPSVYHWEPPFSIFPLPAVWMGNLVTVKVWTGAVYTGNNAEEEKDRDMVYVTESGKVFHNENCTYLKLSVKAVDAAAVDSLRNKNGAKYYPCENCAGNSSAGGCVFITTYGNRYHVSEQCSSLKRTVRKMRRSDAEKTMGPCSKCGG